MSRRKSRRIRKAAEKLALKNKEANMSVQVSKPNTDGHKVLLLRDTMLIFPEMYLEVFIATKYAFEEALFAELFVRSKCTRAESPEKADLVVFVGGSDVDPRYYGEHPHPQTQCDPKQDLEDEKLYEFCIANGIPMFGVCRGAQFLHVMNGGKLYQHVNHHNGDHTMWDKVNNRIINKVSSVHHQMCIENTAGGMTILGDSSKASERWLNDKDVVKGSQLDVEAYFYRDTHCLGVQGHPEYRGYHEFACWAMQQIDEYIYQSSDTISINGFRRLKPEFVAERNARWDAGEQFDPDAPAEDENDLSDRLPASLTGDDIPYLTTTH